MEPVLSQHEQLIYNVTERLQRELLRKAKTSSASLGLAADCSVDVGRGCRGCSGSHA